MVIAEIKVSRVKVDFDSSAPFPFERQDPRGNGVLSGKQSFVKLEAPI